VIEGGAQGAVADLELPVELAIGQAAAQFEQALRRSAIESQQAVEQIHRLPPS
jgi:hypothetical protein